MDEAPALQSVELQTEPTMYSKFFRFEYYSGSGNLFLISRSSAEDLSSFTPACIRKIVQSSPHRVDGVLLIEETCPHMRMHYFNCDGSRASMCGNGLRCSIKYVYDHIQKCSSHISLHTDCGKRSGTVYPDSNEVEVDMGTYCLHTSIKKESLCIDSIDLAPVYFSNTGVPHAVLFSQDTKSFPVVTLGKAIRHHSAFYPHGTNVNFASVESYSAFQSYIRLRTYERGVEDETGACGTGAVATALSFLFAHFPHSASRPVSYVVHITFTSGEVGTLCCLSTHNDELSVQLRASAVWHPSKSVIWKHEG